MIISSFGGEVSSERSEFKIDQEEMNYRQMHGPHLSSFAVKWGKEIRCFYQWGVTVLVFSSHLSHFKFLEAEKA